MTIAAEKVTGHPVAEKKDEKVVEKRRALGRGLESLLPGPRVVAQSRESASVPGGTEGGETKVPRFARDDNRVAAPEDKGEIGRAHV